MGILLRCPYRGRDRHVKPRVKQQTFLSSWIAEIESQSEVEN